MEIAKLMAVSSLNFALVDLRNLSGF